jgi:preprotein translocase SecE subunit
MGIIKYLQETKTELKEVKFPTITQTISYTIVVVLLSVVVAALLGGIDFGIREALAKYLG